MILNYLPTVTARNWQAEFRISSIEKNDVSGVKLA